MTANGVGRYPGRVFFCDFDTLNSDDKKLVFRMSHSYFCQCFFLFSHAAKYSFKKDINFNEAIYSVVVVVVVILLHLFSLHALQ